MAKTWKQYEKRIAEYLQAERTSKGKLGEEVPDLEDELFIYELKTRKAIPRFIFLVMEQIEKHRDSLNKIPISIVHQDSQRIENDIVFLRLSDFKQILELLKSSDEIYKEKISRIKGIINE